MKPEYREKNKCSFIVLMSFGLFGLLAEQAGPGSNFWGFGGGEGSAVAVALFSKLGVIIIYCEVRTNPYNACHITSTFI